MSKKLTTELFFWVITAFITLAVLFPIVSEGSYRFLWPNVFLIVTFITVTRLLFFLKHTFLSNYEWLKAALILFAPILIFLLIQEINRFQTFIDQSEWHEVIANGIAEKNEGLSKYIYTEILFFGVAGVIATLLLPVRMLVSIWRVRNLGKE